MNRHANTLPSYIRRVARGKHGFEHLCREEAEHALLGLFDCRDDLQLGAFLIAMRIKGETAAELAGFTQAARQHVSGYDELPDRSETVDLPCYAGKRRASHTHLAAALKVRDKGVAVLVHGVADIADRVSAWQVLEPAGVKRANSVAEAAMLLDNEGIAYLDLEEVCPPLFRLYHLRERLGVRSFANSVARLLNPLRCTGQLNGIFHTPFAFSMAEANVLLEQPRALIFNGAEGEPELYADRQKVVVKQDMDAIRQIDLIDSGCEIYPKNVCDHLYDLQDDFQRMLAGQTVPRETVVLQRMHNALLWAANGIWPDDWHVRMTKE